MWLGFNTILRRGYVTYHEYMQVGKGRDVGLNQISKFEAKVANGNSEQTLSRDLYRLGRRFDFFRMLSCYFTTIGFYFNSLVRIMELYSFTLLSTLTSKFRHRNKWSLLKVIPLIFDAQSQLKFLVFLDMLNVLLINFVRLFVFSICRFQLLEYMSSFMDNFTLYLVVYKEHCSSRPEWKILNL